MEESFILKLTENFSRSPLYIRSVVSDVENPEPEEDSNAQLMLVRFNGDAVSRRYDPSFLKYSLQELVC